MELSAIQDQFDQYGISIVGLLYDPVQQLARFKGKHKIQYTLLSDEDSSVIKQYGLLNKEMPQATKYFGVPYPGIFLVDAQGKIVAKFAEEGYKDRPLLADLLSAVEKLSRVE